MGICLIVKSGSGIDTSNATVTADKILSGYTVYVNDNKITGTMKNVGNQNKADATWGTANSDYYKTWCGVTNWVWEGWHDGTSGFNVGTLAEHTWDCDIPDASWCLNGYTYWKSGTKYTGTMTVRGKKTWTLGANGTQTIESGWHDGTGTVSQSISVDSGEWWITPNTSQQQLCWSGWYYSKNRGCYGNANLVASNIKSGVSIFGVTGNYVETKRMIIDNGALTGLCTFTSWANSTTNTDLKSILTTSYNNSTWWLLCSYRGKWGGSEAGAISFWNTGATITGSKSWVSANWTIGKPSAATFNFQVGADLLVYAYWTKISTTNVPYFVMNVEYDIGWSSGYAQSTTVLTLSSQSSALNTYSCFTLSRSVSSKTGVNRASGQTGIAAWSEGNIRLFSTYGNISSGSKNSSNYWGFNIWAKNLWLDTTASWS